MLLGVFMAMPLNADYEFFPIYNGFALNFTKYDKKNNTVNTTLVFSKFEAFNNEQRLIQYPNSIIPFQLNNVSVECIVPNQKGVNYQYKLNEKGKWSPWVSSNIFEFMGLSPGKYSVSVRASVDNQITGVSTITFQIAAPWYRTWFAYALYLLLIIAAAYFIVVWQTVNMKKQKKKLLLKQQNSLREQAEKFRNEIMLLEQEQLKAEYNQLKQQLKNKTIELANKAKDNEVKNRLLLSLKEKCNDAEKNPVLHQIKWTEIQKLLDSYLNIEDKTFEIQMDELHQGFFKELKARFPSLSNNDLRLCAYIKIGLNSKEIAEMLNIQPSSSYISRSRLRKKLNLKADEDLYSFLNEIAP